MITFIESTTPAGCGNNFVLMGGQSGPAPGFPAATSSKESAMTKHVKRTETSGTVKATSVADYIVERLAREGIAYCFGVAATICSRYVMRSAAARR
jgi:hypothetical protein